VSAAFDDARWSATAGWNRWRGGAWDWCAAAPSFAKSTVIDLMFQSTYATTVTDPTGVAGLWHAARQLAPQVSPGRRAVDSG
jgi:hypothetical protein